MRDLLLLPTLRRFDDAALLALRLLTGAFLVWEMWFNISSAETMRLVVGYFRSNGFAYPEVFAPLSAWAQFLIGLALIAGFATRWAGLLLAFNFVVGMIMVHLNDSFREQWPALALLFVGLFFLAWGGGRYAVDAGVKSPLLSLPRLARFKDEALLALRLVTGTFLVHGVWDNVTSSERMQEFVEFLTATGFPQPALMAPLSVYAQLLIGIALILGLLVRWAGLVLAFNFIVAVAMVHWAEGFRGWWPAIVLVALGFLFAAIGAGRYALDQWIGGGTDDDRDQAQAAAAR